jgi:hypothetical protein
MLYIVLLCAVGTTVKLSFIVFGALAILTALFAYAQRENWRDLLRTRQMIGWLTPLALAVIPWLIRGVILSGYLLYPSPLISFPVPWKIPYDLVQPITSTIHNWAMGRAQYTPGMPVGEWFAIWFPPIQFELKEAVVYLLITLALAAVLRFGFKKHAPNTHGPLALILISFLSLIYWFISAPTRVSPARPCG